MITEAQITAAIEAVYMFPEAGIRNPEIREPMRAALEAAEKAAWQPIASAPKDGTTILLFDPRQLVYIALGCWLGPIQGWSTGCWEYDVSPTHWFPTSDAIDQMLRAGRPTESA